MRALVIGLAATGEAAACTLRAEGWDVIATVRELSTDLGALGAEVRTLDMGDAAAVSGFRAGRPVDLLIANAGTYGPRDAGNAGAAAEWLETLEQGARRADFLLLSGVIEQIREQDTRLADVLAQLAEDFEYDEILALIQSIEMPEERSE